MYDSLRLPTSRPSLPTTSPSSKAIKIAVLATLCAASSPSMAGFPEALSDASVNGQITGEAILATCRTGRNGDSQAANNQRFQDDCNLIVGGAGDDPSGSTDALDVITADQISAQSSVAIRTTSLGAAMIQGRLAQLRVTSTLTGNAAVIAGITPFGQSMSGGGASGDASFGRLGTFLNVRFVNGDNDETRFQPGYDFDGWTIQGGADYRFNDNLIGGVALRLSEGDVDYKNSRGKMDGDSWGLSLYGSYSLDSGFFVDGLVSYGQTDYTLKRNVDYVIGTSVATQVATSDPSADVWNINAGAGYTYYADSWSFTPSVRLNYLRNEVDSFSERMSDPTAEGGAMALAMDSQTYESFTSSVGIQIANAISHKSGVIVPQLEVSWVHEYLNSQERVGARFVNDINDQPFFILTEEPVSDYAHLRLGVSAQFAHGRSAFLSYSTLLGYNDVTYNAINAGIRLEF